MNIIGAVTSRGIGVTFIAEEKLWKTILSKSGKKIRSAAGITGVIETSGAFYLYMPEMMYFSRKWVFIEVLETLLLAWTSYIIHEKPDSDFLDTYTDLVYKWVPDEAQSTLLQRGRWAGDGI